MIDLCKFDAYKHTINIKNKIMKVASYSKHRQFFLCKQLIIIHQYYYVITDHMLVWDSICYFTEWPQTTYVVNITVLKSPLVGMEVKTKEKIG